MKYRWSISPPQPSVCARLSDELQISSLLAQCLVNRGFLDTQVCGSFLEPRLKNLADPFLLPDMARAVDRLLLARCRGEALVIFGDYDVDGVTSTALLADVLGKLGWTVHVYLPNRRDDGYGLSGEGIKHCLEKYPVKLVLAVDCGSTAGPTIDSLGSAGVEVIVLDHHQIASPPPKAVALVNPQANPDGPFGELCSAGLSFKLAHALLKRLRELDESLAREMDLRTYLDLVALGTIADLVPLKGENRILVSAGLDRLGKTPRPGLIALKHVAQCGETIGSYEVGFQLAPRLNAAGRLETAEESFRLLLARDLGEAEALARSLEAHNQERKNIERAIADEIIGGIQSRFKPDTDYVIVEGQPHWHVGVVGIVASRVVGEFHRPTIVLGGDGDEWRGSGRSIAGFDLAEALRRCDDLLVRHGGHALAAGLAIHPDKVDLLRARLNELARSALTVEHLQPTLRLDAEVPLSALTIAQIEELARLSPTGQGNSAVRLAIRGLVHQQPPQRMGKQNQHVKFRVTDGLRMIEAVWWNCGNAPLPKIRFDLACTPQINEYNGRRSVQLRVLDWS